MFKTVLDNGLKSIENIAKRGSCFRASLSSIKRPVFSRMYPVTLIKPDGSSFTINYHEPIAIIKLPFDLNQLTETERKRRMLKRQMSSKVERKVQSDEIIDKTIKFDPKKYLNINKKK